MSTLHSHGTAAHCGAGPLTDGRALPAADPAPHLLRGDTSYLPAGARIDGFELLGLVGPGRSGPVYRARELASGELCVIKEFIPAGLATRSDWTIGTVFPEKQAEYDAAVQRFFDDARWLSRIGHAALLPVHEVWWSHGTACASMPWAEGGTLLAQLALRAQAAHTTPGTPAAGHPSALPGAPWLLRLLTTLASALSCLHESGRLHRSLSPSKVLFSPDGQARLLALGLNPLLHTASAAVKLPPTQLRAGFSALESYPPSQRLREATHDLAEGPWTDVYALGALAYCAITGAAPKPAPQRGFGDTAEPLVRLARGRFDERLLDAIDRALALWPAERPQSCAEFLEQAGLVPRPLAPAQATGEAHADAAPVGTVAVSADWEVSAPAAQADAPAAAGAPSAESSPPTAPAAEPSAPHAPAGESPASPAASTPSTPPAPSAPSTPPAASALSAQPAAAPAAAAPAPGSTLLPPGTAWPMQHKRLLLGLALCAGLLGVASAGAFLQSRGWMPVWLAGQPPAQRAQPTALDATATTPQRPSPPASGSARTGPRAAARASARAAEGASRPSAAPATSLAAGAREPSAAVRKERCAQLLAQLSLGASPSAAQLERLKVECP